MRTNISTLRVMPNLVLVKINGEKQKDKREKIGDIYLAPNYLDMKYNLQCGEIINFGKNVKKLFPEIAVGDIGIFHHSVEDGDSQLIDTDEEGNEYRMLRMEPDMQWLQLYGIVKAGKIIPYKQFIFLSKELAPLSTLSSSLELTDIPPSTLRHKLDELKAFQESLAHTFNNIPAHEYKRREEIETQLQAYERERARITRLLNAVLLKIAIPLHVNETTTIEDGIHENRKCVVDQHLLVPLETEYGNFFIAEREYIFAHSA